MYGFMVGQLFPLFATCFLGPCTCAGFIVISDRWSPDRSAVRRTIAKAGSVMALCMAYVILGAHKVVHEVTNQSREQMVTTLAMICISINICL